MTFSCLSLKTVLVILTIQFILIKVISNVLLCLVVFVFLLQLLEENALLHSEYTSFIRDLFMPLLGNSFCGILLASLGISEIIVMGATLQFCDVLQCNYLPGTWHL